MPLLSPVETIKILLPGLLALTSILVVVITFLLEIFPLNPYRRETLIADWHGL